MVKQTYTCYLYYNMKERRFEYKNGKIIDTVVKYLVATLDVNVIHNVNNNKVMKDKGILPNVNDIVSIPKNNPLYNKNSNYKIESVNLI